MRKTAVKIAFLAILMFGPSAHAETSDLPPAMSHFAKSYATAIRTHDVAQMKSLVAPQSVACIEKVSSIWFDQEAHYLADKGIGGEPVIALSDFSMPIPPGISLPAKPQKLLTLSWKAGTDFKGGDTVVQLGLIETPTGIFQTLPCPTPDAIKMRNAFFEQRGYKPPA